MKLLIVDCDGTLTPIKTYYTADGRFMKIFSSKDSYAIKRFKNDGFRVIILTSDKSGFPITQKRAQDWKVESVYSSKKYKFLKKIMDKKDCEKIIYVGNGPEDTVVLDLVDIFFAPKDATQDVLNNKEVGRKIHILNTISGNGVLNEVYEHLNNKS